MKPLLLLLFISLAASHTHATVRYVRAGANNTTGLDWNNAFSSLPSTLIRGYTYYVAAGTYPSRTFSEPESGTTPITIRRATNADHGTNVGWSSTYDGPVIWPPLRFSTSYWTFTGVTWNGFIVNCTHVIGGGGGGSVFVTASDVHISYVLFFGTYSASFGHSYSAAAASLDSSLNWCDFVGAAWEDHINLSGRTGTFTVDHCRFSHLGKPQDGVHRDLMNPYGSSNGGWGLRFTNNIVDGDIADCLLLQTTVKLTEVLIASNVFSNLSGRVVGFGSSGAGCSILTLSNNTFWAIESDYNGSGVRPDIIIAKNNFYGGGKIRSSVPSSHTYWESGTLGFLPGVGNLGNITTARFLNPSSASGPDGIPFTIDDGFNLTSGSALMNAGASGTRTHDILGNEPSSPPDIGAYEFSRPPAEPIILPTILN